MIVNFSFIWKNRNTCSKDNKADENFKPLEIAYWARTDVLWKRGRQLIACLIHWCKELLGSIDMPWFCFSFVWKSDSEWVDHTVGWLSWLLNQLLLISPSDVDWILGLHAWIPERLTSHYSSHLDTFGAKVMRDFHIKWFISLLKLYTYIYTFSWV